MSTEKIYKAVVEVAKRRLGAKKQIITYLDVGAGRGELIKMMNSELNVQAQACDYHVERFSHAGVTIRQVNLNTEDLPYDDNTFDLVTCSEVIEHLENYRKALREVYRVSRPGGVAIFTTPNVLNMNSRTRFFGSGFFNLFGPLPVKNDKLYSTGGHITPIPYFYLAHALLDTGFSDIKLSFDKKQRASSAKVILCSPFLLVGRLFFWRNEVKRFKTITPENKPLVDSHFTWGILTARTIVVSAQKIA